VVDNNASVVDYHSSMAHYVLEPMADNHPESVVDVHNASMAHDVPKPVVDQHHTEPVVDIQVYNTSLASSHHVPKSVVHVNRSYPMVAKYYSKLVNNHLQSNLAFHNQLSIWVINHPKPLVDLNPTWAL